MPSTAIFSDKKLLTPPVAVLRRIPSPSGTSTLAAETVVEKHCACRASPLSGLQLQRLGGGTTPADCSVDTILALTVAVEEVSLSSAMGEETHGQSKLVLTKAQLMRNCEGLSPSRKCRNGSHRHC